MDLRIAGIVWLTWLITGTLFYSLHMQMSLSKGLYMAVNIGYSIGWGDIPETTILGRYFSTIFVTIGSSFIGLALGLFAEQAIADHDNWYTNQQQKDAYEKIIHSAVKNPCQKLMAFLAYEWEQFRWVIVWMGWIAVMVVYSSIGIGWSFDQALYFAIASCSTGGHWSIPTGPPEYHENKDWLYLITGVAGAIGVPLMGVAMGSIANFIMHMGDDICADLGKLKDPVTEDEMQMLEKYGLVDGNKTIERAEYVAICCVRLGLDPSAIQLMVDHFNDLDEDGEGDLSMKEILKVSSDFAAEHDQPEDTA